VYVDYYFYVVGWGCGQVETVELEHANPDCLFMSIGVLVCGCVLFLCLLRLSSVLTVEILH